MINKISVYKIDTTGKLIDTYDSNKCFDDIYINNNNIYLLDDITIYRLIDFSKLNKINVNDMKLLKSYEIPDEYGKISVYYNDDMYLMNRHVANEHLTITSLCSLNGKFNCGEDEFYVTNNKIYYLRNQEFYIQDLNSNDFKIEKLGTLSDEQFSKNVSAVSSNNNDIVSICANYKRTGIFKIKNKYIGGTSYNFSDLEITKNDFGNSILPIAIYNDQILYYDFNKNIICDNNDNIYSDSVKLSKINSSYLFSLKSNKLFIFKVQDDENQFLTSINL